MRTIKQALTIREVRHKLMWMIGIIFLTRVISMIPVPGVDASVFKSYMQSNSNDALNLFSTLTGGSFENFSMFALGITPYITAQILVQLFAYFIKPIEKLQKRGEHGQKVTKRITAIIAVAFAALQSCMMAVGFNKSGMISGGMLNILLVTIFMTAGTGIMIWLSNILTDKSIGQGVSVLLMANIVSRLPAQLSAIISETVEGKDTKTAALAIAGLIVMLFVMMIVTIYMSEGYHPMKVQYSQKMSKSGEAANTGIIPVRVGITSVMPVIFASCIMSVPQLIATITGKGYGSGLSKVFLNMLSQDNWVNAEDPVYELGLLIYIFLIIFFAFIWLTMTFNAAEISESIRKAGGFIPGVRAGVNTENYIQAISRRATTFGVVMLLIITVIPMLILGYMGVSTTLSSTSLIIVIGVVTETIQQIQLELAGRNYSGLLCD